MFQGLCLLTPVLLERQSMTMENFGPKHESAKYIMYFMPSGTDSGVFFNI